MSLRGSSFSKARSSGAHAGSRTRARSRAHSPIARRLLGSRRASGTIAAPTSHAPNFLIIGERENTPPSLVVTVLQVAEAKLVVDAGLVGWLIGRVSLPSTHDLLIVCLR